MNIEMQKKALRELRGFNKTQKEFAKDLGISQSAYANLESGYRKLSNNMIAILKKHYPELDTNIFFDKQFTK